MGGRADSARKRSSDGAVSAFTLDLVSGITLNPGYLWRSASAMTTAIALRRPQPGGCGAGATAISSSREQEDDLYGKVGGTMNALQRCNCSSR